MKRILVTGEGYSEEDLESLKRAGFEILQYSEIDPKTLRGILPTLDAHILGGSERLDAEALAAASRLRLVSFVGTGYGAFVDEETARARGIAVMSTPGVMAPAVAEHTIGLLLGLARGLFAQNEAVKRAASCGGSTPELSSMAVGIAGMGAVGTRVARILRSAFGCRICYANRTRKDEIERELDLRFVDIDSLFAVSDVVLLLVATAPETKNFVNADRLARARRGLILVNTAGPALVEPAALRAALNDGQVAAAAFDGYWIEPLPPPQSDPFGLLTLPDGKFVVTPHTAAKTVGTWNRMVALAVENVLRAFPRDKATK